MSAFQFRGFNRRRVAFVPALCAAVPDYADERAERVKVVQGYRAALKKHPFAGNRLCRKLPGSNSVRRPFDLRSGPKMRLLLFGFPSCWLTPALLLMMLAWRSPSSSSITSFRFSA